jgi:transcription initiation factor TFIIIB Brf1 subunit/transcription initiation factor TFIIB
MKKCPVCNSSRITQNEKGELECKKCGYLHSSIKKAGIKISQEKKISNFKE